MRSLVAILLLLCWTPVLAAEEPEKPPDDLFDAEWEMLAEQDVVLTAAKHKQKAGFSPASVIVITRRDIEESGASTLLELLRRYPGMHVYMSDPFYPNLMIRGTIRALVMIDGREINLEIYVAPFYRMLPIGLEEIERIEIVLGPNSALYGANAVSAVINIQTRKPSGKFGTHLSVAAGEHGTTQVGGILEGGIGPLALQGTLRVERALSWMDRDLQSESMIRSNLTAVLKLGKAELSANAGVAMGSGRIYGVIGYMDFKDLLLVHTKAEFTYGSLLTRAYWYGLRGRFGMDLDLFHPDTGADLGSTPIFEFIGDTFQTEAQYDISLFKNNLLIAGGDFRLTMLHCDQMVDSDILEYRFGAFLHDEHRFIEKFLLTVGVRFDWNNKTDIGISPRVALVYNPAGEHYLRLSGATAFRKPTLLESSINFRINTTFPEITVLFEEKGISNPDLKNEILTGFELSYRGSLLEKKLRIGADAYFNLNRDWISFRTSFEFDSYGRIDLQNTSIGYRNSEDDFNIIGVNFFIEGDPVDALTLFLRGECRYEWYIRDNRAAPKVPKYLGSLGGTLRLSFGPIVHLAVVHVAKREDDVRHPLSSLEPSIWQKLPAHTYVMAALTYRLKLGTHYLDLGLSWFNPFGEPRRERAGTRAPDGTNYGGEFIGSRALLTARFHY